ncbi:MAG: CbiX/SirB N-terminal domain-containing protein [Cyanobacteria bacterium P01_F01_bin.4]
MVVSTAYLLIAHGSRDPRPQAAMNRLAQLVRERLKEPQAASLAGANNLRPNSHQSNSRQQAGRRRSWPYAAAGPYVAQATATAVVERVQGEGSVQTLERTRTALQGAIVASRLSERVGDRVLVGTACLENSPLTLREQICEFGRRVKAAGIERLKLVPLFLMRGVHVMEDIPAEVSAARQSLGDGLELCLCPHLGSHTGMPQLLLKKMTALSADGHLLVAHGSRRPKGNRQVESLAKSLGTAVAYWSIPPDLETQVVNLMQQGCQRLIILPYFLFTGGITDAVIHLTEELAERFPKVCFRLLLPLGATPDVADLVVDLVQHPNVDTP